MYFHGILWPLDVLRAHSLYDIVAICPSAFIRDGLSNTWFSRGE
ncbi:hypothetical protein HMPREF3038_01517 [Akkermansia sp. KLE1797]|nr:hypothetical protein HMPREF3038_01517 [Akkermansia sp. KLE1797]KXU54005.1 hypothetical protein HMPREF3039_01670 [Akkermansia sp. KLE1798]KZA05489.1 hypothetical protein HMPREF1326_00664 [Akkermansia sp. KLE1605]